MGKLNNLDHRPGEKCRRWGQVCSGGVTGLREGFLKRNSPTNQKTPGGSPEWKEKEKVFKSTIRKEPGSSDEGETLS